jgi:sporulation protein YlmC with PRC-barrel domain
MPIQIDQVLDWRGRAVVDRNGKKIGTFEEIYLDAGTDEPAWAAVKAGTFGLRRSRVVPIALAQSEGNSIRVPFTKQQVKTAPTIDSDGWVPERDQAAILRHYGMSGAESRAGTERRPETTAHDTPAPESSESPEPTDSKGSAAPAGDNHQPNGMRLKRYTVTETLTRRSEFGAD